MQPADATRILAEDAERGAGPAGDRLRQPIGEELGARALLEQLAELRAAGDEPARRATEGLAEGAGDDVDAIAEPIMLGRAAAGRAEDAEPV